MRFLLTLPLLAALALPLAGCFDHDGRHDKKGHCNGHNDDPAPSSTVNKLGAGQWVYIESTNGVETYRPQSPAGWVRNTYAFAGNGTLVVTWAGPNDGPVSAPGTWSQSGNDVTINLPQNAAMPTQTVWHIQSIGANELKITR